MLARTIFCELDAAYLVGQLEAREAIQEHRRRIGRRYADAFSMLPTQRAAGSTIPPSCEQPFHVYYLLLASLAERTAA